MLRRSRIQGFCSNNALKPRWAVGRGTRGALKGWGIGSCRALRAMLLSQLQRPSCGHCGTAHSLPLTHTVRGIQYATNAANFETQVLQSQQAICLVYYIRNSNCSAYLRQAEELVDQINRETSGAADDGTKKDTVCLAAAEESPNGHDNAVSPGLEIATSEEPATCEAKEGAVRPQEWLKLCTINADENRNLASAFSVERAKLPITYFIMQGTIIDKVVGHIAAPRLSGILYKFLEHYQKEMNVDLIARTNKEAFKTGGLSNPIPTAATTDLLDSASTQFLQEKMLSALAGPDMIRLPEEASHLDGIRKTLQQAKKKAHADLQSLHQQLGMDIRRLSDSELHARYHKSSQFIAMAVISSLEALFLARSYASLGDIAKNNVVWAKQSLYKEFEPVLSDAKMRRLLALVDANLVKGDLRLLIATNAQKLHEVEAASSDLQESEEAKDAAAPLNNSLQSQKELLEASAVYFRELIKVIDNHVDTRAIGEGFPDATVEMLLTKLKDDIKLSKLSNVGQPSESANSLKSLARSMAEERASHTKTILTCIINLFASDPKGPATRSRLFSILY